MDSPPDAAPPGSLLPRYRRILSFGDVLDESLRVFRQHWVNFALMSAVTLLPSGLLQVWLSASGLLGNSLSLNDLRAGRFVQTPTPDPPLGPIAIASIVPVLFYFLWSPALTAATAAYLHGSEPTLLGVYGRALQRFFTVFLATLVFLLGVVLLSVVGGVLFVITLAGVVGSVVALVALLFWWLRPGARKTWVKWLIILCTPFGLPTYYAVRWSTYIAAAVLEQRGPLDSLRRSSELLNRHVFRVLAIMTMSSLIIGVLLYGPAAIVGGLLLLGSSASGEIGSSPISAVSGAIQVVLGILFQSIGPIVYTLMFVDLRNRREGTDMTERLAQLEAAPITPGG